MAIRAVFFDAAGTLFDSVRPIEESYAFFARKHRKIVPTSEIQREFRACFTQAPPLAFPGASSEQIPALERQWWKNLVSKVFDPFGPFREFEAYFDELFAYFADAKSWKLFPDTESTLRGIKQRGLILKVVSNFDSRLFGILRGLGIENFFDSVVISSRAGYAKPAPEIFLAALKPHALQAHDALHVGDSFETDIEGARRAGLRTVWLNDTSKNFEHGIVPIHNLAQVLNRMDSHDI